MRYRVARRFRFRRHGGPWAAGTELILSPAHAALVNRFKPHTLIAIGDDDDDGERAMLDAPTTRLVVEAPNGRNLAGSSVDTLEPVAPVKRPRGRPRKVVAA